MSQMEEIRDIVLLVWALGSSVDELPKDRGCM